MPDPTSTASQIQEAVAGAVGSVAALGVFAKIIHSLTEWHSKRAGAKEAHKSAGDELRAKSKSDDNTAAHRAAELTLQLSERQVREVERAYAERAAAEEELMTCEQKYDELIKRMATFERDHVDCPGASAFAALNAKYDIIAAQNEWMEKAIVSFTGMTPPAKTMPPPAVVAEAVEKERRET